MQLTEKITLNSQELIKCQKLIEKVHQFDQTYSDPYLSNTYNYFAQMPTFVLAYVGQELVGLVMLYADEKPNEMVDIYVLVDPDFRRQKIASKMIIAAKKILNKYGYTNFCFPCEKNFLNRNPYFLTKTRLNLIADTEYNMATTQPIKIKQTDQLNQVLKVVSLKKQDVKQVAQLYSKAFSESISVSVKYIVQSLANEQIKSFILLFHDEIVGYCTVDRGKVDYLFGLFIADNWQKQGFGSYFIKKIMALLQAQGSQKFVLDVDIDNNCAIQAYKNAGFKIRSKNIYLKY